MVWNQGQDSRTLHQTGTQTAEYDAGLRSYMLRIYNYMACGLAVSGLVAWFVANVPSVWSLFFAFNNGAVGMTPLGWIVVFAPLGLILFASFRLEKMKVPTLQALYWTYVVLQGISLALLVQFYAQAEIFRALLITAGAFAGLSLYGYTTKRNLGAIASFLIMGLIGLIIASVVNMFLLSDTMQLVIAAIGVLIFSGLIAWETQSLKRIYYSTGNVPEFQHKMAIMGAWNLYISFMALFRFILILLSNRE